MVGKDPQPSLAMHGDGSPVLNVADILRIRAGLSPTAVAVTEANRSTTFSELDLRAARLAAALAHAGCHRGDRVAFIGANSATFLEVLYGATRCGAIFVPVNYRLTPREIGLILRDADPSVVVVDRMGLGWCSDTTARQHVPLLLFSGAVNGTVSEQTAVTNAMPAAAPERPSEVPATPPAVPGSTVGFYEAFRDQGEHTEPGPQPDPGPDPDSTALLLYTSGTTGPAKGIMLSGRNLGVALHFLNVGIALDQDSVCLAPIPFFHIAGLGLALAATLNGANLLLREAMDPAEVLDLLETYRVTHAVMVPTVIQRLLAAPECRKANLSALRYIVYGASPIALPVLREATEVFGCKFLQSYGLTESTGGFTLLDPADHTPDAEHARRLTTAGRPLPDVEVKIVNPESLDEVAPGERGEVLVRGPRVMQGYWRRPDLTAQVLSTDGWLRTGDGGSFDADGYLTLHDRIKDMIVSGGENIYPAEVESVLFGHPEIAEVSVIGVPSQKWGESPFAVVVRIPGSQLDERQIMTWSRDQMAHFKCPVGVTFIDQLPRTASGKVQKTVLRERYATG